MVHSIRIMIITVALFFFMCAVRPDSKCRGCVAMIVMITAADAGTLTAGDAEDAW